MSGLLVGLGIRADSARRKMKKLGAMSEETAKTPEELGLEQWILNHDVARIRGIKRTKDGRYYVEGGS